VVSEPSGAATSRRALLGAASAGAALVLSACSNDVDRPAASQPAPPPVTGPDVTILNRLLDLKYKAIAAYTAGIPLLEGPEQDAAKLFLQDELYHAGKLYAMIRHAGGEGDRARASYPLGHPRSRDDMLRLLHTLEHTEVATYLAAVPLVSDGETRGVLAAIASNDAQHVVVLRTELSLKPLTGPYIGAPRRSSS
jgi:hypothetical protein